MAMSKDYVGIKKVLSEEDQMRFDNARVQFMTAITANGNEEIAKQVKEAYANIVQ